jgi:hypothetical protein
VTAPGRSAGVYFINSPAIDEFIDWMNMRGVLRRSHLWILFLPAGLMARENAPALDSARAGSEARRRMLEQAVVGTPPVWPAAPDSAREVVVTSDENLPPNPETDAVFSGDSLTTDASGFDAADYGTDARSVVSRPPPAFFGEGRMTFAIADDFQLGGRLGAEIADPGIPLDLFFDLEGRPFGKAVRKRESPTLQYQFREHRFTPGLGIAGRLPLGDPETGAFWTFGGGAGFSFGYYRGSNRSAEVTFPVWMETGFRLKMTNDCYLGIGYQYFPLPSASSHRVALVIGIRGADKGER